MARPQRDGCLRTRIAVRAYSEDPKRVPVGSRPPRAHLEASPWTLILDCETTIDATQKLRVGFYQVRNGDKLRKEGIFYNAATLRPSEMKRLRNFAASRDLELVTFEEFRSAVFLQYAYALGGTVVGFNLPFDLSRIALNHSSARRSMRGGFSLQLTPDSTDPRVRVKHLNPKAALIDFASSGEQDTPRGMRRRQLKVPTFRGRFVDAKTAGAAVLSRCFTLESLAVELDTATRKQKTDEHGKELTAAYLKYAETDVQVTWECYAELCRRYREHGLTRSIDRLLSEASIGKAYLHDMGVKPFLACNPTFPRERFGEMLCAYYGGRAEIRNRRVIKEIVYCDFKSMYPTVNSLMGLWDFVIADELVVEDATEEIRTLLKTIRLADLHNPATWRTLCALVRVRPIGDIFPVRAEYNGATHTIGLNHLTAAEPLWFTLADCIVSKLLTGKCPEIVSAVRYRAGPQQDALKEVAILGRNDFRIDPKADDFFKRLIDLRDEAKAAKDPIEKTLKIIANSTSYGIFIEVTRDDAAKSKVMSVFGPDGECEAVQTHSLEQPGRFFHPLLGVLITGAARLMLGIAEKLTKDCGLDWVFCDTDSWAFTRPDGLSRQAFHRRAQAVVDWFEPLSPYEKRGSILKIEDVNCGIGREQRKPLFCFAISSKRYALFNLDSRGRPILRKASAHGLGHLLDPYEDENAPPSLPKPRAPLSDIGVHRWHHDFWIKIIEAAIDGHANQVQLDWHSSLSLPAAMRYSASSPQLLAWLDKWNAGKRYQDQIHPFGFMLAYTSKTGVLAPPPNPSVIDAPTAGRPRKHPTAKPVAPFSRDPSRAFHKAFDRVTGEPVDGVELKTYAEALAQYHLSTEDKFLNGEAYDCGRTERRHVVATGFVLIGKEANHVGDFGEADPIAEAVQVFRIKAGIA